MLEDTREIIKLLGGITAVARLLDIRPPSVHKWIAKGIPDGRLRELAPTLEVKSEGRFSRRQRWPDKYLFYWPEMASPPISGLSAGTAVQVSAGAAEPLPPLVEQGLPAGWDGIDRRDFLKPVRSLGEADRRKPGLQPAVEGA